MGTLFLVPSVSAYRRFDCIDKPQDTFSWLLYLQAAVGYDYEGKTEEHASQKGEF